MTSKHEGETGAEILIRDLFVQDLKAGDAQLTVTFVLLSFVT